jgi:hypothetical protein
MLGHDGARPGETQKCQMGGNHTATVAARSRRVRQSPAAAATYAGGTRR